MVSGARLLADWSSEGRAVLRRTYLLPLRYFGLVLSLSAFFIMSVLTQRDTTHSLAWAHARQTLLGHPVLRLTLEPQDAVDALFGRRDWRQSHWFETRVQSGAPWLAMLDQGLPNAYLRLPGEAYPSVVGLMLTGGLQQVLPSDFSADGLPPCALLGSGGLEVNTATTQSVQVGPHLRCHPIPLPTALGFLAAELPGRWVLLDQKHAAWLTGGDWRGAVQAVLVTSRLNCDSLRGALDVPTRCELIAATRSESHRALRLGADAQAQVQAAGLLAVGLALWFYIKGMLPLLAREQALRLALGQCPALAASHLQKQVAGSLGVALLPAMMTPMPWLLPGPDGHLTVPLLYLFGAALVLVAATLIIWFASVTVCRRGVRKELSLLGRPA